MTTWMQLISGAAFDLIDPQPEAIRFKDIAEALARIGRYTGHIPSGHYSVAQHCVIGADYIEKRCGAEIACAFLLHDAHEAFIGDIATPVANALACEVQLDFERLPHYKVVGTIPTVKKQIKDIKERLDRAIYVAAGIEYPLEPQIAKIVKEVDLRMLANERRDLLGRGERSWGAEMEALVPLEIKGRIKLWNIPQAADEYAKRLMLWAPSCRKPSFLAARIRGAGTKNRRQNHDQN